MSYTDAELLMACQIAYLNFDSKDNAPRSVESLVYNTLNRYGKYDLEKGCYVLNPEASGEAKRQFEVAEKFLSMAEQNHCDSWRNWKVVDACNKNHESGYYGCLIDTGDGNAIMANRGTEVYDSEQVIKDGLLADAGRVNAILTAQQKDAEEYIKKLSDEHGDDYEGFYYTGHSLGGSLATHAAMKAPEKIRKKLRKIVSYDGPGFSNEYLKYNKELIDEIRPYLYHYKWSVVGVLLFQPEGITDITIKAHDGEGSGMFAPVIQKITRHFTQNVELDENGYIQEGEPDELMMGMSHLSKGFEILPHILQKFILGGIVISVTVAAIALVKDGVIPKAILYEIEAWAGIKIREGIEDFSEMIKDFYKNYQEKMVSGEYEVNLAGLSSIEDNMEAMERDLMDIANRVKQIKRNLPYDSTAGSYYKAALDVQIVAIDLQQMNAKKLKKGLDKACIKYSKGDTKAVSAFA